MCFQLLWNNEAKRNVIQYKRWCYFTDKQCLLPSVNAALAATALQSAIRVA